jgi:hypothetical protein
MSEYLPEESNAFMWRKMPHGQLGKCAEALALRKGFPQQLADLHTFEEMEQSHTDPPPRATTTQQPQRKSESGTPAPAGAEKKVETKGAPADALTIVGLVASVDRPTGKKVSYIKLKGDRREFSAFNDAGAQVIADAQQFEGTDHQVRLTYVERKQGDKTYYNAIAVAIAETPAAANPAPIDTAAINPFDRTPWQEG